MPSRPPLGRLGRRRRRVGGDPRRRTRSPRPRKAIALSRLAPARFQRWRAVRRGVNRPCGYEDGSVIRYALARLAAPASRRRRRLRSASRSHRSSSAHSEEEQRCPSESTNTYGIPRARKRGAALRAGSGGSAVSRRGGRSSAEHPPASGVSRRAGRWWRTLEQTGQKVSSLGVHAKKSAIPC
jgi:hypothetical protein